MIFYYVFAYSFVGVALLGLVERKQVELRRKEKCREGDNKVKGNERDL